VQGETFPEGERFDERRRMPVGRQVSDHPEPLTVINTGSKKAQLMGQAGNPGTGADW